MHIHFTGTAANPTLKLKRHTMTSLLSLTITFGPDTAQITGTPLQLKHLFDLAIDSSRANVNMMCPTHFTTQEELNDLRTIRKEWFPT